MLSTTDIAVPRARVGPGANPDAAMTGPSDSAGEDPLVATITDLVARLREHAAAPDAVLACSELLDIVGTRAHVLAILIFSLLNFLIIRRLAGGEK